MTPSKIVCPDCGNAITIDTTVSPGQGRSPWHCQICDKSWWLVIFPSERPEPAVFQLLPTRAEVM